MVDDARYRTKSWLSTYILYNNLTKDDDTTPANYYIAYGMPDYPLVLVFTTKNVDLTFSIMDPTTKGLMSHDKYIWGYEETVPIVTTCIDKSGITGTVLRWKASAELRRITENNPLGSLRVLEEESPKQERIGGTILYQQQFKVMYRRNKA